MTSGTGFDAGVSAGVRPGDVIAGKYRVERLLGAGGMGVVLAARHLQLDERVAIKLLLPDALQNEEAVVRFEREARAAVKIKSEHVARVIDVGKLETGAPYLVMEYLEGGDLDAWIRQKGPMAVELAAELVLQACEAIAEAHALGIVHRDLKPANLFCVRRADGLLAIKVLDFGISKMDAPTGGPRATSTGAIFGSPLYMSPEQMRSSKDVDARADIWSLGVILFELVTGKAPFDGSGMPEIVLKIVTEEAPSLRALRPDVPPGFVEVVARCLQKSPDRRFSDVAELALALGEHAPARAQNGIDRIQRTLRKQPADGPPRTSRAALGAAPTQAVSTESSGPWGAQAAPNGRGGLVAGVAVVLVLAIAGGVLLLTRAHGPAAPEAAPSAEAKPPPPLPVPVVAPSETARAVPSATAPPVPSAPPPAPSGEASAAPHGHGTAQHAGPAAPTAPPLQAAKPSCTPPYTFDPSGTKIFKKECL